MSQCDRPVFIVGAARSGTTLVQSLIAALPGFYSAPETHFFDELMVRGDACDAYQVHRPRVAPPARVSEAHLLESLRKGAEGFLRVPDAVRAELLARARAGQLTPKEYLCSLMENCSPAGKGDRQRWVEKTPTHASYLREIFSLFPDAQVICVHRKPAGVMTSAVATFGMPASISALDYYRAYRDVMRFLQESPERAEQIHFAFYDKIKHSDQALDELIAFLGVRNAPPADALRQAVRDEFRNLYGDSSMQSIQAGMSPGGPGEEVSGWRASAIEGFAGLLSRHGPEGLSVEENGQGGHTLAVAADLLLGGLYIIKWRLLCLGYRAAKQLRRWKRGVPQARARDNLE